MKVVITDDKLANLSYQLVSDLCVYFQMPHEMMAAIVDSEDGVEDRKRLMLSCCVVKHKCAGMEKEEIAAFFYGADKEAGAELLNQWCEDMLNSLPVEMKMRFINESL